LHQARNIPSSLCACNKSFGGVENVAQIMDSNYLNEGLRMSNTKRIVIVVALLCLVGAVFALRQRENPAAKPVTAEPVAQPIAAGLPRLVDLGAEKCRNCKMMIPVLAGLSREYAGQLQVDFIDVWDTPDEGKKYGIRIIPTQIFFDANGNEVFRHEGFFSKQDILAKWKELGVTLSEPSAM